MKKLLLTAVAFMMAAVGTNAQFKTGTFSLQPKLGLGIANITGIENVQFYGSNKSSKTITGAGLIGAELEYQIKNNFSLACELNYSLQGCAWDDFSNGGMEYKNPRVELGYVKLPIIGNFYLKPGLALKAGLQFGVLTNAHFKCSTEGKLSGREITTDISIDMNDDFESIDVSIPFGVSYETRKHWVFDARYQLGLTKINKNNSKDYKNSVFMITAGYKFKLK